MNRWSEQALTAEQMALVDERAISEYGVKLIQMMENAGRQLASLALKLLDEHVMGESITILCGPGNNGGGGMVAARHLHNWGAKVSVILAANPKNLKRIPAEQWRTIVALGLVAENEEPPSASLVIDSLLGYTGKGNPRAPISIWIDRANNSKIPILSLDLPSGLDASTGNVGDPCITASATLTLAMPKTGLFVQNARRFVGELYLADIGIPPIVYNDLFPGFRQNAFFESDSLVKIS